MSGRRTGKKKEFGRAASGRSIGGKRPSKGMLLKPTSSIGIMQSLTDNEK